MGVDEAEFKRRTKDVVLRVTVASIRGFSLVIRTFVLLRYR